MELYNNCFVLIESDWNLKVIVQCGENQRLSVLIESDWNLKSCDIWSNFALIIVLIESDWNLKQGIAAYNGIGLRRINRIRLEFKERCRHGGVILLLSVLIESDWNLKKIL